MQTVRVPGACLNGAEAEIVTVEAWFEPAREGTNAPARTEVSLSGLPDAVVRDARTRVLTALTRFGLGPGPGRLHLNLVPAGRRKRGELLDLPLALAASAASGHLDVESLASLLCLGELGIDGRIHDQSGGLAAADAARRAGIGAVVAPPRMALEASHLPGVSATAVHTLDEAIGTLWGRGPRRLTRPDLEEAPRNRHGLERVRGQALGLHAACVAAAGGHGLLMVGPPGTGKSLIARALVDLLPAPSFDDRLEITRVLSAAGRWPGGLVDARPFRAPHHTVSFAGLVGGGSPPQPGEITLAHRGLLFLDELTEFKRDVLETLRQPLESGTITISRAAGRLQLPAAFQLVAAMNPCPCGFQGHPTRACRDTPNSIRRYRDRVSGPLLDRIDLRVELGPPSVASLTARSEREIDGDRHVDPAGLQSSVDRARARASERQGGLPNAALDADALDLHAPLTGAGLDLVSAAAERRGLSARAIQSLRRVARTLADLADLEQPGIEQFAEALELRREL